MECSRRHRSGERNGGFGFGYIVFLVPVKISSWVAHKAFGQEHVE